MASSAQIEDQAAGWLAQRDSGNWTAQQQAELDCWLDESLHNRVAYLRLEAAWEKVARAQAFSAAERGTVPPPRDWQGSPYFRNGASEPDAGLDDIAGALRGVPAMTTGASTQPAAAQRRASSRFFALAASVLLAIGAGIYLYTTLHDKDRYATPIGGTASIPLADGSKVTLNTASEIHVALDSNERRIDLERGEAYFEVAHDPARPFTVHAGRKQVIAVGTRFSVRRDETDDVRVTVTEGKVRVVSTSDVVLLAAGSIARASNGSTLVQKVATEEAENSLSWRVGYLVFDNATLGEAVAEFNRYTREPIRIDDPRIASMRISGKFRSDSCDVFLRLLLEGYAIDAQASNGQIVLTRARQ